MNYAGFGEKEAARFASSSEPKKNALTYFLSSTEIGADHVKVKPKQIVDLNILLMW